MNTKFIELKLCLNSEIYLFFTKPFLTESGQRTNGNVPSFEAVVCHIFAKRELRLFLADEANLKHSFMTSQNSLSKH